MNWLRLQWQRSRPFTRVVAIAAIVLGIGLIANLVLSPKPITYAGTFVATGSMSTARSGATATLLPNGRVLVAGGVSGGDAWTILSSAELYDVGQGGFVQAGSMAQRRTDADAVALADGRVLIAGGHALDGTGALATLASAELYDPATGAFTATGSMHVPRAFFSMVLLADGRVLVAGGLTGSGGTASTVDSAEVYDPNTGTFALTGNLSIAREAAAAALLPDGRVLVAGGAVSDPTGGHLTATAELYNPGTGTFAKTGSMANELADRSATLLIDGTVLVGGGHGDGDLRNGSTSVEIYDLSTGTFAPIAPMLQSRVLPNLVALVDGTVLVAGGPGPAELFDFDNRTFSATGAMLQASFGATSTILRKGEVLFAGGSAGTNPTAFAELYH
jgi:hypothetical protein